MQNDSGKSVSTGGAAVARRLKNTSAVMNEVQRRVATPDTLRVQRSQARATWWVVGVAVMSLAVRAVMGERQRIVATPDTLRVQRSQARASWFLAGVAVLSLGVAGLTAVKGPRVVVNNIIDGGTSLTQPLADAGRALAKPITAGVTAAIHFAESQLGKPYVYAGSGPNSYDCSGLTMMAWATAGVSMPHNAELQYQLLRHVSHSELEPGDLVFFGSPIHHVGLYVGGGEMIDAPYTGVEVEYRTIYRRDYAGAARPA
jgi:cell wall-associated NlpC family hydrolase